jgi:hypothetical protein
LGPDHLDVDNLVSVVVYGQGGQRDAHPFDQLHTAAGVLLDLQFAQQTFPPAAVGLGRGDLFDVGAIA